jgi:FG-GAP-like repeat
MQRTLPLSSFLFPTISSQAFATLILGLIFTLTLAASAQSRVMRNTEAAANAGSNVNTNTSFQAAVTYGSGGYQATSVAVADVNGDGIPDLIVAHACESSTSCNYGAIGILLGNGDGTFQPAVTYNSGGDDATYVTVADVNQDGKLDLVVANLCVNSLNCSSSGENGGVAILLGNGDGTFQPAVSYSSTGLYTFGVAVADLNGDGKPDLALANDWIADGNAFGSVSVLLSNGSGSYEPGATYAAGVGIDTHAVVVADVNGDGKPDLVLCNAYLDQSTASVAVLLGNGDGTFQPAVNYDSGGETALSIAAADVNGDGNLDIVVANSCASNDANCGYGEGAVAVLLGNGDGTFQPEVSYSTGGYEATSIAIVDVNRDGKLDLVVANECGASFCNGESAGVVGVLWGNGDGTFQNAVPYGAGGDEAFSVAVADFNGDGLPDLAVANYCMSSGDCSSSVVGVLLGAYAQAITFTINAPPVALVGHSFTVAATGGGSGKPVIFTSSGSCSNAGPTYTMTSGKGTCEVIANQAGNKKYAPAPQVTESVTATEASPIRL